MNHQKPLLCSYRVFFFAAIMQTPKHPEPQVIGIVGHFDLWRRRPQVVSAQRSRVKPTITREKRCKEKDLNPKRSLLASSVVSKLAKC